MKNLRLKAARAAMDLSQEALAQQVGVSRQTINAIEKGDWPRPWMSCSGKNKKWGCLLLQDSPCIYLPILKFSVAFSVFCDKVYLKIENERVIS